MAGPSGAEAPPGGLAARVHTTRAEVMNNIFMGTYSADGLIYDYSGVWQRRSGGIDWKAIVRNADIVCRPHGTLHDDFAEHDVVAAITALVEKEIERRREKRLSAEPGL
jgi:hypothetical protein